MPSEPIGRVASVGSSRSLTKARVRLRRAPYDGIVLVALLVAAGCVLLSAVKVLQFRGAVEGYRRERSLQTADQRRQGALAVVVTALAVIAVAGVLITQVLGRNTTEYVLAAVGGAGLILGVFIFIHALRLGLHGDRWRTR
jgi:hypothetical protein